MNAYGTSAASDSGNGAQIQLVPDAPTGVTTFIPVPNASLEDMVISWTPEDDGGSLIVSYKIEVLKGDVITYAEDSTNCQGTDTVIVSSAQCSIPISVLKLDPYRLHWGVSVSARVAAINSVG